MRVVFKAREDRSSSMNAVMLLGILYGEYQHISSIMLQNKSLKDEMIGALFSREKSSVIREESSYFALEGMDYLIWQERNNRLSEESVHEVMMSVGEKSSFIPSGDRDAPGLYPEETGRLQLAILNILEQIADLVLFDCGALPDTLSRGLIEYGSLQVICLQQRKELIDEVMMERGIDMTRTFFIITDYDYSDIYNTKNIARLYGIPESRIGVIPRSKELENSVSKGEVSKFIKKNINSKVGSKNYYFMKELKTTGGNLLSAVNYGA